jgi:hypothetical protein
MIARAARSLALVGEPRNVGRELDQPPHLRHVCDRHHRCAHRGLDSVGAIGGESTSIRGRSY